MLMLSLMLLIMVFIPFLMYLLSLILYFKVNLSYQKMSPFECGFDNKNTARIPFSTRFFLLGLIFIIFDIEVVLLLPMPLLNIWSYSMVYITLILLLLFVGLIHEWKEGSLDWMN
nr:NADH dehydrogenase subunit 3 [Hirudinaria manillensis]